MSTNYTEMKADLRYLEIPGFPGYRVGEDGSVWSDQKRDGEWHELIQSRLRNGYRGVNLYRAGKSYHRRVGGLVLLAFVGKRPRGKEARHLNSKPHDNRLPNLCYGTPKQNAADRLETGWKRERIDECAWKTVVARIDAGEGTRTVAREMKLNPVTIQRSLFRVKFYRDRFTEIMARDAHVEVFATAG